MASECGHIGRQSNGQSRNVIECDCHHGKHEITNRMCLPFGDLEKERAPWLGARERYGQFFKLTLRMLGDLDAVTL